MRTKRDSYGLRLSHEEKRWAEELGTREGLTWAQWVRATIRREHRRVFPRGAKKGLFEE